MHLHMIFAIVMLHETNKQLCLSPQDKLFIDLDKKIEKIQILKFNNFKWINKSLTIKVEFYFLSTMVLDRMFTITMSTMLRKI
jgi:hypothetical protein